MGKKTITIEHDVDIDEFPLEVILEELDERLDEKVRDLHRYQLIKKAMIDILRHDAEMDVKFKSRSLDDQMKIEHLNKVWNKYTPSQFESALPE